MRALSVARSGRHLLGDVFLTERSSHVPSSLPSCLSPQATAVKKTATKVGGRAGWASKRGGREGG